jgi:hypothetical protein
MQIAEEAEHAKELKGAVIRWEKEQAELAKLTPEERAHRADLWADR